MRHRACCSLLLCALVLAACQQNTSSEPSGPPAPAAQPPQQAAPPPPDPGPDRSLAFIQLDPGKFTMESIQSNKKSIPADPKDDKAEHAQALIQLGHANYMIGRVPTAKDYYERAVRANGKLVDARLGLSNTYAQLGQLDDSLREINALLAVDPAHPEALYNKGLLLLYGKNDPAHAKQAWEQLVKQHPSGELARLASVHLRQLP